VFGQARERFEQVVSWLEGPEAAGLEHGEVEDLLDVRGRALLRQLYQAHLDVRAAGEPRRGVVTGADGVRRTRVEPGHPRALATVFGEVTVSRAAYRAAGAANLHPADAALNLPAEKHSHGLRKLAAAQAARGSFGDAAQTITRATGQHLGKRQAEELAARAAADFDGFYRGRQPPPAGPGSVLVLSADGKGIVMRPGALRPATAKAAAAAAAGPAPRLPAAGTPNRKRMAEVGAVYDITPAPRSPLDILPAGEEQRCRARPGPEASGKWLTASITTSAAAVISQVFAEAARRDPARARTWIALVDGNNHQIRRIRAEAAARGMTITIIIDFVHVLEYLWKAAWCLHRGGDPAAGAWVRGHALTILCGDPVQAAAQIRQAVTAAGLSKTRRAPADACMSYLFSKAPYLDYPHALASGWPIATGVIEGACRYLVKDRMDITGARWGLHGAEAILKLRALHANGDFDEYWRYHLQQERQRNHQARYQGGIIPDAA
jgi:hypothetical protein